MLYKSGQITTIVYFERDNGAINEIFLYKIYLAGQVTQPLI